MAHQNNYGISNIKKVSRYCYYAGLGTGLMGLVCYILISILNFSVIKMIPPCSFFETTGYYCPGCGGTRSVISLLHGNVIDSLCYHPFVPYAAICYVVYEGSYILEFLTGGRVKGISFSPVYFYIGMILIVVQWIGKNFIGVWYGFLCLN